MKKALFNVVLFCFLGNIQLAYTQTNQKQKQNNEFTIGSERHIVLHQGVFYDAGGSDGFAGLEHITTLHAEVGFLSVFFEYIELPVGAELWIYEGKSIEDEPIAVVFAGDKLPNIEGKHLTFRYIPPAFFDGNMTRGWKANVEEFVYDPSKNNKVTWPESDCPFAIPLCDNSSVMTGLEQYTDLGNINDDSGTCYSGTGTGGSVWYSFSPETDGLLDFTITPTSSTDYDFVLWDITNGCASGERVQMSCNYSLYTGPTGLHDVNCNEAVGNGGNCTSDSKGSDENRFNRRKQVYSNRRYAICVNFYSGSNHGFTMNFQQQSTSVSIGDNTPPYIVNSFTGTCTLPTTLTIHFNEWVDCSTIQGSDFNLPGYTFTVVDDHCQSGRTLSVDLSVSPAIASGSYNITVTGITDMCGNNMNSVYPIVIGTPVTADAGPDKVSCRSGSALFGYSYSPSSQTLTGGGSGGTQWIWSNGMNTQNINVSPTQTTTYTVTISNGGCYATDQVTIFVEHPSANAGPDQTVCAGFPVTLTGSGGVTYQWFQSPTWSSNGTLISNNQTVTVSPPATTTYRVIATTANGCTARDDIVVTIGSGVFSPSAAPQTICAGSSTTLTMPAALPNYSWGGGPTNTPWTVSPATTTTYTVTSTTTGCTGTASITIYVNPVPIVTASHLPNPVCPGDVMDLSSTPSTGSTTFTETFETGNSFTLINGARNMWYRGTATSCNGSFSLFIGTNSTTYSYVNWSGFSAAAATNFAYRDIAITGYSQADLMFNWRCLGKSTDHLTVWAIPTTTTPVAGTALTVTGGNVRLGGPYWNSSASCNPVTIDLLPYVGTTIRLVFQWTNTGGLFGNSSAPPPASIDDIQIIQNNIYSYAWSTAPAGFSSTNQNPSTTALPNTTYTVTVLRSDGCLNSASFYVADCNLPVDLLNFNGLVRENDNMLLWSTASETNNNYFLLESSEDGENFMPIGKIEGAGTSNELKEYTYNDSHPFSKTYYRLKQIDFDGQYEYSNTIMLNRIESSQIYNMNVWPNPVINDLQISFHSNQDSEITIKLYDNSGKQVRNHNVQSLAGLNNYSLDFLNLTAGMYMLHISNNTLILKYRIIKQ